MTEKNLGFRVIRHNHYLDLGYSSKSLGTTALGGGFSGLTI